MQFFAYDELQIIFAEEALKGKDYRCPECHGRLRVKEGLHRRKHFFHFRPSSFCRQSGKTETHLTIQKNILQSLPEGQAVLEKRFPTINRVADVVWEAKKRIFEVQCSPISLQEVKERMADYAAEGYEVIWVLHDYRFNRKRLSAAENYLRPSHAFFTSINAKGRGFFYDQYEIFSSGIRVEKGPPHPIDIGHPPQKRPNSPPKKSKLPKQLKNWGRFLYYLILKQAAQ
ncbi:MAG: hypothetical protein KDK61_01450 [Simkania sp.]|nr:hypothetical protein [Simkania sp.]